MSALLTRHNQSRQPQEWAMLLIATALLAAGLVLTPSTPASADILLVTRSDDPSPDGCAPADCSLREAVIAANADAGADTIKLSGGTYSLQIPGPGENASATGDLDLLFPVTIEGAGADRTTITGKGNGDRILHFSGVAIGPAEVSGVTIRDGFSDYGGGIEMESVGNGVRDFEKMTLRGVHITTNWAERDGGGIYQYGGDLTVIDSTFSRNNAVQSGGGLWISTLASLTNVTISGNSARIQGGGVRVQTSFPDGTQNDIRFINSTITDNGVVTTTYSGGGGISAFDATTIQNTIVAGNRHKPLEGQVATPDCNGRLIADAHNLIGINSGCEGLGGTDQFGTIAAPLAAKLSYLGGGPPGGPTNPPTLAYFGGHGGSTPTHALLEGSPGIDRGSPVPPGGSEGSCSATDQRNMPRPQEGACDVGAYELGRCFGLPVNRIGTPGSDVMNGTNSHEVFMTFSGDDSVSGGSGYDAICAGDGDDVVTGGAGDDRLDGGKGSDTGRFSEAAGPSGVQVDLAKGTASGPGVWSDKLTGIEKAIGSSLADVFLGSAGPDVFTGLGGNDYFFGLEGDDVLIGGPGANRIVGGPGDDLLAGDSGPDYLLGGSGADNLAGGPGRDHLFGHGGSDSLDGGTASDELLGGPGDDSILGGPGRDRLRGGGGFDSCIGGKGRDFRIGCETAFPFLK